jgi:choline dehydrogenase/5-(hydroxymethyl)furfural/furfural oxidase
VILLRSAVDTPGVGEGLQDHPAFTIALRLRIDAVDAAAPTISVAADHSDHQLIALNHLAGAPDLGAIVVSIATVRSRGVVSLPDPEGEPLVELGQFGDRRDLDDLARAVGRALELFAHPVWESVVAEIAIDEIGTPSAAIAGDPDAITDWVERHAGGHHHVSATCADGVVTDQGRVRGYEQLFVCDASLFRAVPRHDPYVSLIDLAERTVAGWQ